MSDQTIRYIERPRSNALVYALIIAILAIAAVIEFQIDWRGVLQRVAGSPQTTVSTPPTARPQAPAQARPFQPAAVQQPVANVQPAPIVPTAEPPAATPVPVSAVGEPAFLPSKQVFTPSKQEEVSAGKQEQQNGPAPRVFGEGSERGMATGADVGGAKELVVEAQP